MKKIFSEAFKEKNVLKKCYDHFKVAGGQCFEATPKPSLFYCLNLNVVLKFQI